MGIHVEDQMKILRDMTDSVSRMHFVNKRRIKVRMPFQAGTLLSLESIIELYNELESEGATYSACN